MNPPLLPLRSPRGFALIIVLSAIVLLLALVVGFFSRVQTELQSSSSFQSAESARNLAEYAVNLVQAQIKAGTSGQDGNGGILAWASQPGAIRTYDTSGNLVSIYKLYSSNPNFSPTGMVGTTVDPANEANALRGWDSNKALFTDLNEPLNGQYPILDPAGLGHIKGFSVAGAPVGGGGNPNSVPMPGAWLYLLRDGTVVTPTGSGNSATVSGASANNPIVGRIAFWSDDESCKVNLNTAGGGPWDEPAVSGVSYSYTPNDSNTYSGSGFNAYWSLPIAAHSKQECAMALNQPVLREYQRYPGHPANTYVTAVFPELTNMNDLYGTTANPGVLPRLQNEGSKGGNVTTAASVTLDADRLYASVDEALFQPSRTANSNVNGPLASRSAFFVTTVGRSPDVNLFNEPRISIWPITKATNSSGDTSKMTAYDRLIAFCQTINKVPYYFCRMDPGSENTDLSLLNNENLLSYLRKNVTRPVPGFGGPAGILGKYSGEANQITTEIFDYIRSTNARDTSMGGTSSTLYRYAYTSKNGRTAPTGAVVPIHDSATNSRGLGRFPTLTKVGIIFMGTAIHREGGEPDEVVTDRYQPGYKIGPPLDDGKDDPDNVPEAGTLKMRAMLVFEMFNPGAGYGRTFPRMSLDIQITSGFQWAAEGENSGMFASGSGRFSFTKDEDWARGNFSIPVGGRISCADVAAPLYAENQEFNIISGYDFEHKRFTYTPRKFPIAKDYPFLGLHGNDSPNFRIGDSFYFGGGTLTATIRDENGNVIQRFRDIEIPAATLPVPDIAPIDKAKNLDLRLPQLRLRYGESDTTPLITEVDTVRSVSVQPADFRVTAAISDVPKGFFKPMPGRYANSTIRLAHNLFLSIDTAHLGAALGPYGGSTTSSAVTTPANRAPEKAENDFYTALRNGYYRTSGPLSEDAWVQGVSASGAYSTYLAETDSLDGVKIQGTSLLGDWDNAGGMIPDGPFSNMPDEMNMPTVNQRVPYFGQNMVKSGESTTTFASYFTPNRMMPSAVMLGSLPTGVNQGRGWQTLLFRPSRIGHPGLASPPDYLLLDLFTMPVIEPYAISEPLSTAGRVNMNYQILPYTYITRSTGVQAVLRSEQLMALDNTTDAHSFKLRQALKDKTRWKLNLSDTNGTLKGFKDRFDNGDIFRSASEICSIWLVPDTADGAPGGPSYNTMSTWWDGFIPTGDNTKESSYSRIYPRLTTKSNTYTVHYRVQALKKPTGASSQNVWTEGKDKVVAEYRGSTTIERYIDPNDPGIPDYTSGSNQKPLDSFYKFRVLAQKQFTP